MRSFVHARSHSDKRRSTLQFFCARAVALVTRVEFIAEQPFDASTHLRYRCTTQEGQRPQRIVRQINQPARLLLLLLLNGQHLVAQLHILHQHVAVDAQEVGEEGLDRFEILV